MTKKREIVVWTRRPDSAWESLSDAIMGQFVMFDFVPGLDKTVEVHGFAIGGSGTGAGSTRYYELVETRKVRVSVEWVDE